jgi:hypothetical protein
MAAEAAMTASKREERPQHRAGSEPPHNDPGGAQPEPMRDHDDPSHSTRHAGDHGTTRRVSKGTGGSTDELDPKSSFVSPSNNARFDGSQQGDATVCAEICSRLLAIDGVDWSHVDVTVSPEQVMLDGAVADRASRIQAVNIARACAGDRRIRSRLNVPGGDTLPSRPSRIRSPSSSRGSQR